MESNPSSRSYSKLLIFIIWTFVGLGNCSNIYFTNPISIQERRTIMYAIPHGLAHGINYDKLTGFPSGSFFISDFGNIGGFPEEFNEKSSTSDSKPAPFLANIAKTFPILSSNEGQKFVAASIADEGKIKDAADAATETPILEMHPYVEKFINTVKRNTEHLMEPKSNASDYASAASSTNGTAPENKTENEADAKLPETTAAPVTSTSLPESITDNSKNATDDKELASIASAFSMLEEADNTSNAIAPNDDEELTLLFKASPAVMDSEEASNLQQYEEIKKIPTAIPGASPETPELPLSTTATAPTTLDASDYSDILTTQDPTDPVPADNFTKSEGLVLYKLPLVMEVGTAVTPAPVAAQTSPPASLVPPTNEQQQPEFIQIMRQPPEMPKMGNTWLRDVALKSLDGNAKYQQILAVNVGNVAISLSNGNGTEVVSFWKELFPASRFFQQVSGIAKEPQAVFEQPERMVNAAPVDMMSPWNKLGGMFGMALLPPASSAHTASGQLSIPDRSSGQLVVDIDPRSIGANVPFVLSNFQSKRASPNK